jgi:L-ascorbate metabolism protein UlaG (beta-lactamase superfamily)
VNTDKSFVDLIKWQWTSQKAKWPDWIQSEVTLQVDRPRSNELLWTFVNHSTVLIQSPGFAFLTDPIWSDRTSPVSWAGPKRVRAPGLAFDALPELDFVLVSHNHYDHMDLPTLKKLSEQFDIPNFVPLGDGETLRRAGVKQVVEMDWWQSHEVKSRRSGKAARITFVPAQHWSSRWPWDRNLSLWGGFVVEADGATVYYSGDTGWTDSFAQISARFPRIDLALLPIGAYEPRWFMQLQHMNPDDAVRAHLVLKPRRSLGVHFGTFQLTDEAVDDPVRHLNEARLKHGLAEIDFSVLAEGKTDRMEILTSP